MSASSISSLSPEPFLPPEIERIIFEIACKADVKVCTRVMLTAKRVKIWVEPFLYENVRVIGGYCVPPKDRLEALSDDLLSQVRTVWWEETKEDRLQDLLLGETSRVEELLYNATLEGFHRLNHMRHVKRLEIFNARLTIHDISKDSPMLSSLTHIATIGRSSFLTDHLLLFKSLTHISFRAKLSDLADLTPSNVEVLHSLLDSNRLRVCLIEAIVEAELPDMNSLLTANRLGLSVGVLVTKTWTRREDWNHRIYGVPFECNVYLPDTRDRWEVAERIIEQFIAVFEIVGGRDFSLASASTSSASDSSTTKHRMA